MYNSFKEMMDIIGDIELTLKINGYDYEYSLDSDVNSLFEYDFDIRNKYETQSYTSLVLSILNNTDFPISFQIEFYPKDISEEGYTIQGWVDTPYSTDDSNVYCMEDLDITTFQNFLLRLLIEREIGYIIPMEDLKTKMKEVKKHILDNGLEDMGMYLESIIEDELYYPNRRDLYW